MKYTKKSFLGTFLVSIFGILVLPVFSTTTSAATFQAGRIIDDSVMTNKNSMSVSQIQSFLNSKMPSCDTNGAKMYSSSQTRKQYAASRGVSTPFTCLKNYSQSGKSAAQIISDKAQKYSINPQVLIVLLQKEQGLITDDWPWPIQYRSATGYGCPDTAPCDSQYYGLSNQLDWSAKMFRSIINRDPNWYSPYIAGYNSKVYWHPDTSRCGGQSITISNWSTAGLYSYTPYRPNQAALIAGYGSGDSCSSYGNRNFHLYFNDWFGSTIATTISPVILDGTTDKSGETATIGFKLSKKPTASVNIPFTVSSSSNAKIILSSSVKIRPENWNRPEKNIITVKGIDNQNLNGTLQYSLRQSSKVASSDSRYNGLTPSNLANIYLLQQDTNSTNQVYRLYNPDIQKHLFTASMIEYNQLLSEGWRDEGVKFNYCEAGDKTVSRLHNESTDEFRLAMTDSSDYTSALQEGFKPERLEFAASSKGDTPVYWRYNASSSRSFYTKSATEGIGAGYTDRGIVFNTCQTSAKPIFRMYRYSNDSHFYTKSRSERNALISDRTYRYEQPAFYTCSTGIVPVYRLYRPSNDAHFFTTSNSERVTADKDLGYRYEGVKYNLCADADTPVYRLYRPSNKAHFWTSSNSERKSLSENGFRSEGVKFEVE